VVYTPVVHPGRLPGWYIPCCTPREATREVYLYIHQGGYPGGIPCIYTPREATRVHREAYTQGGIPRVHREAYTHREVYPGT